jgi:hypothetical protein
MKERNFPRHCPSIIDYTNRIHGVKSVSKLRAIRSYFEVRNILAFKGNEITEYE